MDSRLTKFGRLLLGIPYVQNRYSSEISKEREKFNKKIKEEWERYGDPITAIPSVGWDEKKLYDLINNYSTIVLEGLRGKHLSGTIYSKSLETICNTNIVEINPVNFEEVPFYQMITERQKRVYTHAFEESFLWNSLHSDEFGIGAYIDYQVVHMVADMFGENTQHVMGFVTSGGTESLMLAVRCYRNWGMEVRGHSPGQGVILACKSVHAAIMKAAQAYLVKVVLIDTDKEGRMNVMELIKASENYGNDVIMMIGSAPSYPLGVIDPIKEIARVAYVNGCGMHVDCCLGGFLVNNLPQYNTNFLDIKGVTSISADTHKNGFAPKGSSVLVTKSVTSTQNLAYYSIYAVPGWSGGVYGTPKDAGSQSCTPSLTALLAMLSMGKEGYKRATNSIYEATVALAAIIKEFKGKLHLLVDPEVNVVAFEIDKEWGLEPGAIYAFAHEMSKRKIILNTLSNNIVHFCVTIRFAAHKEILEIFRQAITESLIEIEKLNQDLVRKGNKFPGDAGMYCALETALDPQKKNLTIGKYIENSILGRHGAIDGVKSYFLSKMDPY